MINQVHQNGFCNNSALVLNANYSPLTICSVKRAICLAYLNKVEILETGKRTVHSPTMMMPIPSVVKLKDFVRYNSMDVLLSRKNILQRDQHQCMYCGKRSGPFTIDHVIPREQGGLDSWSNLVTACPHCNVKKSNRTPEEANMPLRKRPIRPNRIHYFQQFVNDQYINWRPYLFMESPS